MNILFAATPEIALETLEVIYHSKHELLGVVCSEEKRSGRGLKIKKSPIRNFAEEKKVKIFSYKDIKDPSFMSVLGKLNIDLLLVFAFGHIISESLINLPKYGSVNIHTSLLPKYRGAAPIQRCLINCENETGISFMKMDAGLDTGPVIETFKIEIKEGMNTEDLEKIMSSISSINILQTIDCIKLNNLNLIEQNEDDASYASKINKQEALIDWSKPAIEIIGKINGLCPNPCAYSKYQNERIIFYRAVPSPIESQGAGKIISSEKNELLIGGIDKCISIKELARESKKRMTYKNFFNGSKNFFLKNEIFE